MTKMKKQKSGGCKFFQTLARAFSRKKKSNLSDDDGIAEPPFSTLHDVPEAKQAATEKDSARQGTQQDKVPPKTHQKPHREVPAKAAAKATSIDLDKVQREAGLVNNEIAKDRLKIRPSKRAPRKYADRLEQRVPEASMPVHSEKNKAADNLLPVSNQKGKGSVTPESNMQTTEGNTNKEKSNKAPSVAQKQRDDATEGKEGSAFRRLPSEKKLAKKLPRADVTEQPVDGAHGTESDTKTAGAADQHGSEDSLSGKASTNVHLGDKIASSGFGGSAKWGAVEGLSQSMAGGRKLPRTLLSAGGESESGALLAVPLADGTDSKLSSTAKLCASGSSLNTSEVGLRESHRRSARASKYLDVSEDAKLGDNKLRSSGRGSTRSKANSKEIKAESEAKAGKIRESTKKKKDGKKERNSTVSVTSDAAESGVSKVEVEPAGENIWPDINQNESLSLSLKSHLSDTAETNQESEIKHGAKDPTAVPVVPTKASKHGKEAKTGIQRAPSAVKENCTKETLGGEVAGDGSLTSDKGAVKPAKDRGIPELAISGDSKKAENRKSWRIEPHGATAISSASHSRDASIDSAGNSTLESSEGEKAGDGAKTALLLSSSESISAIGETGRSSFKASDKDENEFNKAFQKIKTKQTISGGAVDDAPSRNSFRVQSKQPKDGDDVTAIPENGSLKSKENLSENRNGASSKSLRGSGRKAAGDAKPAENHSATSEDKKPGVVTTEADAGAVDGGEGGSSANRRRVPPEPPANKRSGKVQPKPAEGGKEVAWASMARRMSRDFSDKKLQSFEAKNDEQNPDHDIEGEGNFERGDERSSVKQLVKKLQQKKISS